MIAHADIGAAVFDWLLRSTALLLLTAGVTATLRKLGAPAALRHLLWLLAIFAVAVLPAITALTPLRIAVLPALLENPAPTATGSVVAESAWTFADAFAVLYAVVASALIARVLIGQWRVNAVWRQGIAVENIDTHAATIASTLGLRRRIDVRLAENATPMTWGVLRPKILLPLSAAHWPPQRRHAVLMHELSHVARGDGLTHLLASIAVALYWFQPALWFAVARLTREQERACDDHVLLAGAAPLDYAQALLDVAADRGGRRLLFAVSMAAPSQLADRLKAIVVERHRTFGRRGNVVAIAGAFVTLAFTAAVDSAPAATVDETPTASLAAVTVAPASDDSPTAAPIEQSPAAASTQESVVTVASSPEAAAPASQAEIATNENTSREMTDGVHRSREWRRKHLSQLSPPPEIPALPEVTPPPAVPALPPIPAIPAVEPVPAMPATPASHRKDQN